MRLGHPLVQQVDDFMGKRVIDAVVGVLMLAEQGDKQTGILALEAESSSSSEAARLSYAERFQALLLGEVPRMEQVLMDARRQAQKEALAKADEAARRALLPVVMELKDFVPVDEVARFREESKDQLHEAAQEAARLRAQMVELTCEKQQLEQRLTDVHNYQERGPSSKREYRANQHPATPRQVEREQYSQDQNFDDTGQHCHNPRARRDWEQIWSNETTPDVTLASYLQSLPRFSRQKNDPARCQLDHLSHDDNCHLHSSHEMRRVITKCKSNRCKESGRSCLCRYKLLMCEISTLARVYVEGVHTMTDLTVSSPKTSRLTDEMKKIIDERLGEDASMTPMDLFGRVCKMVSMGTVEEPVPLDTQVQTHVKQWRHRNKLDAMQPLIDLCASCMFDCVENVQNSSNNLLILCDTKCEEHRLVPNLGTGHAASPFRIGLTCYNGLETYVTVQRDPRRTTILHFDSTHSVVKQRYPVFVFGISDCCGKFFPIVYFCTSRRTGEDVGWCCAFLKRVVWKTFMVQFLPRFVMTDADKFNACTTELPTAKILMCWFHVAQNVKDHVAKARLDPVTGNMVYRDLNNLHFARNEEEYLTRRANVLAAWRSAASFCPNFKTLADHIISQWILHPRFSCWQAYLTPPGYAKTNNPLEQYHKTLKLVNKSKKATPTELVDRLDKSRMVFVNKRTVFSSLPAVSQRMKALYNSTLRKKEIRATPLPADDLPPHLVRVRHCPRSRYGHTENCQADDVFAEDPKKRNSPYKSIHILRMQWQSMPKDGWIVDARLRTCECRFKAKYGLCIHVILSTRELLLPCPGMPDCVPRFVSNTSQSRSNKSKKRSRRSQQQEPTGSITLPTAMPDITDVIVYGPHPFQRDNGESTEPTTPVFGPIQSELATRSSSPEYATQSPAVPLDTSDCTTTDDMSIVAEWGVEPRDAPMLSNHLSSFTSMLNEDFASPPGGSDDVLSAGTTQAQSTFRSSCEQTKRRRF